MIKEAAEGDEADESDEKADKHVAVVVPLSNPLYLSSDSSLQLN